MKNIAIPNKPLIYRIKRNNDPIKESTIRKLKDLGIYDSSIQTETEAQQLIKAKLQEIARKKNKKAKSIITYTILFLNFPPFCWIPYFLISSSLSPSSNPSSKLFFAIKDIIY